MSELNLREHKKNNIIVSGLRVDPNKADTNLVIDLLNEIGHHNITPKVVKRFGKSILGKPQLVLVRLATQEDRLNILRDAKLLRQSTCNYTHLNIYINPDCIRIEMEEFKKSRTYRRNQVKKNSVPGSLPANNPPVMFAVSTIISPFRVVMPPINVTANNPSVMSSISKIFSPLQVAMPPINSISVTNTSQQTLVSPDGNSVNSK